MANLSKIVECATQQAFDNIEQKDENALYLTPEKTINIVAGGGIEVEKTVDENGNETYTVSLVTSKIPPTNFIEAFERGYNFNGKTVDFIDGQYTDGGFSYLITFANGYKIDGYCGGGMSLSVYNPVTQSIDFETENIYYNTYTFLNGEVYDKENARVNGFYISDNNGDYQEVTPVEFAQKVTINIKVED